MIRPNKLNFDEDRPLIARNTPSISHKVKVAVNEFKLYDDYEPQPTFREAAKRNSEAYTEIHNKLIPKPEFKYLSDELHSNDICLLKTHHTSNYFDLSQTEQNGIFRERNPKTTREIRPTSRMKKPLEIHQPSNFEIDVQKSSEKSPKQIVRERRNPFLSPKVEFKKLI